MRATRIAMTTFGDLGASVAAEHRHRSPQSARAGERSRSKTHRICIGERRVLDSSCWKRANSAPEEEERKERRQDTRERDREAECGERRGWPAILELVFGRMCVCTCVPACSRSVRRCVRVRACAAI